MKTKMSNINTYLANANEPLTATNYNEIDALVFAQLSYVPFEKIFKDYTKLCMSVCRFAQVIVEQGAVKQSNTFNTYAWEIIPNSYYENCSETKKTFLRNLSRSRRFERCSIHHFCAVLTQDSQWAAFTVDIDEGNGVISMRGTDKTAAGWEEDLQLGYSVIGTGAQLAAFRYIKESKVQKLYLTGHSKGGSNVSSAYAMSNPYVRDKIICIHNFDGPGVNPEFAANYRDGYKELQFKLYNYYPRDSIVGLLLNDNPGNTYYMETDVAAIYGKLSIIAQHDAFTWKIENGEFLLAEQSCISDKLNHVTDELLRVTNREQRLYLINLLERMAVPEMIAGEFDGVPGKIAAALGGFAKAPQKERKAFYKAVFIFMKSVLWK